MVMFCLQIRKQGWKQPEGPKKGEQRQKKENTGDKKGEWPQSEEQWRRGTQRLKGERNEEEGGDKKESSDKE